MKANFNSPKIDEQKLSEFMLKPMRDITSTKCNVDNYWR